MLPAEVWLLVFLRVHFSDLNRVCQVCKLFYNLVQSYPRRQRELTWNHKIPNGRLICKVCSPLPPQVKKRLTIRHLKAIEDLELTHLDLSYSILPWELCSIERWNMLESLVVHNSNFSYNVITRLGTFPSLKKLHLTGIQNLSSMAWGAASQSVQDLKLNGTISMSLISRLFPNLLLLDLHGATRVSFGVDCGPFRHLTGLNLGCITTIGTGHVVSKMNALTLIATGMPQLQKLVLNRDDNLFSIHQLELLATERQLPHLLTIYTSLRLPDCLNELLLPLNVQLTNSDWRCERIMC